MSELQPQQLTQLQLESKANQMVDIISNMLSAWQNVSNSDAKTRKAWFTITAKKILRFEQLSLSILDVNIRTEFLRALSIYQQGYNLLLDPTAEFPEAEFLSSISNSDLGLPFLELSALKLLEGIENEKLKPIGINTQFKDDLVNNLPILQSQMRFPSRELKVLIVDDNPEYVKNIEAIIDAWPNLSAVYINPQYPYGPYGGQHAANQPLTRKLESYGTTPDTDCDITLLDEVYMINDELMRYDGVNVYEALKQKYPKMVFASITGGNKPEWARLHFQSKTQVQELPKGLEFVRMINQLIEQIENQT